MLLPFSFEYDLCHVLTSIALPGKCKHLYLFCFSKFRCIGTDGSFPVDFYLILFFRNDTADQRIAFFFDQYGIFRFFIMIIRRQMEICICMSVYLIPDLDTAAFCPDAASLLSARCRRQPAFQLPAEPVTSEIRLATRCSPQHSDCSSPSIITVLWAAVLLKYPRNAP